MLYAVACDMERVMSIIVCCELACTLCVDSCVACGGRGFLTCHFEFYVVAAL